MKFQKNKPQIIWDWNGTLFDDAALTHALFIEVLGEHDIFVPEIEEWRRSFYFPVSEFYRRMIGERDPELIPTMMRSWADRYEARRHVAQLRHGVKDLLSSWRAAGGTHAILSAHPTQYVRDAATHLGVVEHFDEIRGATFESAGAGKAERGAQLLADLKKRHLEPQHCWIVGDTTHDAEVAKHLGVDCILISGGACDRDRLAASGYPVVETIQELEMRLSA